MKQLLIISLASCFFLSACVVAPGPQARGHGGGGHGGPSGGIGVSVVIGAVIATLPLNHVRLGPDQYYFDGVFYRSAPRGFEVIAAPVGLRVQQIPAQRSVIKHQNVDYFKSKGTWYRYYPSAKQYQVVAGPDIAQPRR